MSRTNVKRVIIIACALLMVISFGACSKNSTIKLGDYVTVEFSGLNGKGEAEAYFDSDALAIYLYENCEKQLNKLKKINDYATDFDTEEIAVIVSEGFYAENTSDNLSNGDTASVKIVPYEGSEMLELLKESGLNFDVSPVTLTVSGLREAMNIDVFENLNLEFEGVSPELTVRLSEIQVGKYGFSVTFKTDSSNYKYKIGDTVNVIAQFDGSQAEENGYIVTAKEKSIVIDNTMAESYLKDASSFDQNLKNIIKTESDNKANQAFTNQNNKIDIQGTYISLAEAESVSELTFQKAFLVYSDTPELYMASYNKAYNFVCAVYKYRVNNANESFVWEDAPEYHYDGYVYSYVFLPNITIKNSEIKYDVGSINYNPNAFASEESLKNYLTKYNYTYTEIQNF